DIGQRELAAPAPAELGQPGPGEDLVDDGVLRPAHQRRPPAAARRTALRGAPRYGVASERSPSRKIVRASRQPTSWIIRATAPVQPVWCDAPSPAPLSPWKYSWKNTRSRHSGSSVYRGTQPCTGRRPSGPGRKIEIRRRRNTSATSCPVICTPAPLAHSTATPSAI